MSSQNRDFNPQRRNPADFLPPEKSIAHRIALEIEYTVGIKAAEPQLLAVDLSHWNGAVDFATLRASGVQAVILKASEGAEGTPYEYKDTKFEEYWQAAMDEGFPIMTYHFWRDYKGAAEKDWYMKCADAFLNAVEGHTACWCDVEWKNTSVAASTRANRVFGFNDLIKGEGIRQGVYCSPALVTALFPAVEPRWSNVYQWDAHWTSALEPTLPNGWSWEMMKGWQKGISPTHSWVPHIDGSQGSVDVNYLYFASEQELRDWMGEAPTPPPVDCCDDHELRIATLEAGQQVLTEVQQDHGESIDELSNQIANMKLSLEDHHNRLVVLEQQIETLEKIKQAICNE